MYSNELPGALIWLAHGSSLLTGKVLADHFARRISFNLPPWSA